VQFGSVIRQNQASSDGGGVYNSGGTFLMTDGAIRDNQTSTRGGGLMQSGGSSTLTNVTVETNRATDAALGKGGGVYAAGGAMVLDACTFGVNNANLGPQACEAAAGLISVLNCTGIVQTDVVVG